jgi:AcrR family transcriptional regulator
VACVARTTWWKSLDARIEELLERRLPGFQDRLLSADEALGYSPQLLEATLGDAVNDQLWLLELWRDLESTEDGDTTLPRLLDDVLATVAVRADRAVMLHYRRAAADADLMVEQRLGPVLVAVLDRLVTWIEAGGKVELGSQDGTTLEIVLEGGPTEEVASDEVAALLLRCFGAVVPVTWRVGMASVSLRLD